MIRPGYFTDFATESYLSIKEQLYRRWGSDVEIRFEQRAIEITESISKSPFLFQTTEYNSNIRKAVIHKNCSMFYEVFDDRIEIVFFWDNSQDPIF